MWSSTPYLKRERDIRVFRRNTEKQLFRQLISNVNIAFHQTLPQDIVSYIVRFIPETVVPQVDIRRKVTLYKRNYIEKDTIFL
jgi:hypothetical protein